MRFLSLDEIGRLTKAVAGSPFEHPVSLALACGARRGELLGAKCDDFDHVRGTLSIRRSLEQTKDGSVFEKTPKSGKSRLVQLPSIAVEMLRELRKSQGRTVLAPGYIFAGLEDRPWPPDQFSDDFRAYVKRAKIENASFHTLRHTCASHLLAAGIHPKVVQEMLGHSTITITMDLYSHVTPSLQVEAASKYDAILRAATAGSTATA